VVSQGSFLKSIADLGASAFGALASPALRFVGRHRGSLPRFQRLSDRLGFSVRTTHYYEPTYSEGDLPAGTDAERDLPGLDLDEAAQAALLARFDHAGELRAIAGAGKTDGGFSHDNPMYAFGDAETLYNMVRLKKPKRIFEIGSGYSTLMARAALAANEKDDPGYRCRHLCIEPFEAPWLEKSGVEIIRQRVETMDLALFDELGEDDILFIDSSHIIRPWGDVLFEFQRIVPRLGTGVLVHVHDIFTPFDYPEQWLRAERRLWNEQYLLESFLCFNSAFEIVLAVNFMSRRRPDDFARACPAWDEAGRPVGGAFWFRRAR
jgi:hypothetical protein